MATLKTKRKTGPLVKIRKVRQKHHMTFPSRGFGFDFSSGDLFEASIRKNESAKKNEIVLTPVRDELVLTPEDRKEIDAAFAEARRDFNAGRGAGPFSTAKELQKFLDSLKKKPV